MQSDPSEDEFRRAYSERANKDWLSFELSMQSTLLRRLLLLHIRHAPATIHRQSMWAPAPQLGHQRPVSIPPEVRRILDRKSLASGEKPELDEG